MGEKIMIGDPALGNERLVERHTNWRARAEKAEAELSRLKPLIDAAVEYTVAMNLELGSQDAESIAFRRFLARGILEHAASAYAKEGT